MQDNLNDPQKLMGMTYNELMGAAYAANRLPMPRSYYDAYSAWLTRQVKPAEWHALRERLGRVLGQAARV